MNNLRGVFKPTMNNFIAFEGLDGCGKTTIINKLKEDFPDFFYTREPGGTKFSYDVRKAIIESDNKDAYGMTLGMGVSRLHNLLENYDIFIDKNKCIISDRWVMSNIVYQQAFDESILKNGKLFKRSSIELAISFQNMMNEYLGTTINPKYIFIHIKPETSIARQTDKEDKDKMDNIDLSEKKSIALTYANTVISGAFGKVNSIEYINTVEEMEDIGVVYIDGDKQFEEVYKDIVKAIKLCFNIK